MPYNSPLCPDVNLVRFNKFTDFPLIFPQIMTIMMKMIMRMRIDDYDYDDEN